MRVMCRQWRDRGSRVKLRGLVSTLWGPEKPCSEPGPSLADCSHKEQAPLYPESGRGSWLVPCPPEGLQTVRV